MDASFSIKSHESTCTIFIQFEFCVLLKYIYAAATKSSDVYCIKMWHDIILPPLGFTDTSTSLQIIYQNIKNVCVIREQNTCNMPQAMLHKKSMFSAIDTTVILIIQESTSRYSSLIKAVTKVGTCSCYSNLIQNKILGKTRMINYEYQWNT